MFVYNGNGVVYSKKYAKQDTNESRTTK